MDSPKGAITEPRNRALQKVGILKMDSPGGGIGGVGWGIGGGGV